MRIFKRLLLYASLLALTVTMIGVGFQTAERGMQALVGTGGPPQSVYLDANRQAVQVTVLGKQVVSAPGTLGDRWSRQFEAAKLQVGSSFEQASVGMGHTLQTVSAELIRWVTAVVDKIAK
ncbi:hypothetical protein [Effusibacillus dendaii]|uniref:Uncharacterized protein n=1 Tax=Effusibacillus dendaii TaxID=2743772 RepID=A0A7I8DEG6_9BACL|nr:hypothetical protein [Effusibacillus dendaii]BCJ88598.1 hypothetical protein skT53_35830 [Effusibacillus dendaii]